jgi:hypothetical protein
LNRFSYLFKERRFYGDDAMKDKIQRGDHYKIPLILNFGGRLVVADSEMTRVYYPNHVIVQIGPYIQSWSREGQSSLEYNNGKWLFDITAEQVAELDPITTWQFCTIESSTIRYSPVYTLNVAESLPELVQS